MTGSAAVAAVVARWGFWILLAVGLVRGELRAKGTAVFLFLWLAGWIGFQYVAYPYDSLLSPYVAALDIALVFAIFKGD